MADPFVAEIRMLPSTFAPLGWALCDGQLMPVTQNTALFSLLGSRFGGNGETTFALPDLRGAAPLHPGQGAGLSPRALGETGGADAITLTEPEMPVHTHAWQATAALGDSSDPANRYLGRGETIYVAPAKVATMAAQTISVAGGSLPHNNMMPYLVLNFCIALQGVYPARP